VVPRYASRLFLLAALLWVGFAPSAFAVRAPSVSALVPSENRVGGSGQFASGRLSIEDQQSPINTPGLEGCGYETASGRLKWLNRDPIEEDGGINLYGLCKNNSVNRIDPLGYQSNVIGVPGMIASGFSAEDIALIAGISIIAAQEAIDAANGKGKPRCEPKKPKKDDCKWLTPGEIKKLKKAGYDPHDIKDGLGAGYDLCKDKDGNIFIKPKDGSGPGDPTGINIKNL